ncbi:MAG: hypothetical protein HKN36_03040 [Hellea sp.]|nr:hypothetical protein [Hellea sp.]
MGKIIDILKSAKDTNRLDDAQFSLLRRAFFADGHVSMEEADMIFVVDTHVETLPEDWNDFFVGAMTDFLIRQTLPVGYVDPIHASWLMERIEQDDRLDPETELELLLNVLRHAEDVPQNLELYTLNKVRQRIVRRATENEMRVTEQDVDELKRILYACAGSGGFSICEYEARFLFDLDEISQNSDNHESWQKLFVGAIANHVMTAGAPNPADREGYKRAQEYLHSSQGIKWGDLKNSFKAWQSESQSSVFLNDALMKREEAIDLGEAAWLVEQINRDGVLSDNERALLAFIKAECPNVHESLEPLLRVAA